MKAAKDNIVDLATGQIAWVTRLESLDALGAPLALAADPFLVESNVGRSSNGARLIICT